MKSIFTTLTVILCLLIAISCTTTQENYDNRNKEAENVVSNTNNGKVRSTVTVDINNWPETSQKAAKNMMKKYGDPDEVTPTLLVWYNTSPFKRTLVYKEEINHDFPMPHQDVLEQFIDYEVSPDKFDELAEFDGSIIVERTKGEISARCDKEGANLLALNLANDIVTGKRTVEEAREFYGENIMRFLQGEKPDYMTSLQFTPARGNVGYSDKTTMDMSKVKELKNNKNR